MIAGRSAADLAPPGSFHVETFCRWRCGWDGELALDVGH
jgi:hypothetical protein